jgi:hypothetical protein
MGAAHTARAASADDRVDVARTSHSVQRGVTAGGGTPRSSHPPISGVTRRIATAVSTSPAAHRRPSSRIARRVPSPSDANPNAATTAAVNVGRHVAARASRAASGPA